MGGANGPYEALGQSPGVDRYLKMGVPNLSSGGQMGFHPIEQIQPESTHPEAIAQGYAKGFEGLVSGLASGYSHAAKSPQAQQQMQLGYKNPMGATQFSQQAAQMPSFYRGNPDFNSIANVGTGMNFIGNPFLQ